MTKKSTPTKPHPDPAACLSGVLAFAERLCAAKGAKLTKNRAEVLSVIHGAGKPIGAYDILDKLSRDNGTPKPPTVYRALEFLEAMGLVHKIESLNAFMSCALPGHIHSAQILICDGCGEVEEVQDEQLLDQFAALAKDHGFEVDRAICEIHGHCENCT